MPCLLLRSLTRFSRAAVLSAALPLVLGFQEQAQICSPSDINAYIEDLAQNGSRRKSAIDSLVSCDQQAVSILLQALKFEAEAQASAPGAEAQVRWAAVEALGRIGEPAAAALIRVLGEGATSEMTRQLALIALIEIGRQDPAQANEIWAVLAVEARAEVGAISIDGLQHLLEDQQQPEELRRIVILGLSQIAQTDETHRQAIVSTLQAFEKRAAEPDTLRDSAKQAIENIQSEDIQLHTDKLLTSLSTWIGKHFIWIAIPGGAGLVYLLIWGFQPIVLLSLPDITSELLKIPGIGDILGVFLGFVWPVPLKYNRRTLDAWVAKQFNSTESSLNVKKAFREHPLVSDRSTYVPILTTLIAPGKDKPTKPD